MSEAVENVTPQASPEQAAEDRRQQAYKAVREAVSQGETEEAAQEEDVVVAEPGSEEEAKVEAPKEEKEPLHKKLDRLVKERERAKAIRREAEQAAAQQRRELEVERQRFERERQEFDAVRSRLDTFKKDPLKGMRDLEMDPEDVIKRIATTDPDKYAERMRMEALQSKLQELETWKAQQEEYLQRSQQEAEHRQEMARRESIVSAYLETAKDATKYPAFVEAYGDDPEYQVRLGHRAADHIKEHLGYTPSREEILEYLEHETKKKRSSRSAASSSPGGAKGLPKTLSRSDLSDRKTSQLSVPEDWEARKSFANAHLKNLMKDFDSPDADE